MPALDGDALLSALTAPDEMTLRFSPWGLGGRLRPQDSARFLVDQMAQCTLHDAVPDDIRANFARVQKVFIYGLVEYDLFTVAIDETHLALEGALRARFVDHYGSAIPLLVDREPETLTVTTFNDLYEYLGDAPRGTKIQLAEDPPERVPRSYGALYAWARRRGLLTGQRNVGTFASLVKRRNWIAHPERHTVRMPPDVTRLIRDAAEIINRLWGQDTPGGRLFPGPIARRPRLVAISPDGESAKTLDFDGLADEQEDDVWTYLLVLAAEHETLWDHDRDNPGRITFAVRPGLQTTEYPADVLHDPCDLAGMRTFIEGVDEDEGDEVEFHDRVFYIRVNDDRVDLPRSPADLIDAAPAAEDGDQWYALRADHPNDAFCAVRDHRDDLSNASSVELLGQFTKQHKLHMHARRFAN
jgi:hypothetical protein